MSPFSRFRAAAILTVLLAATAIAGEAVELARPQATRFTSIAGRETAGSIVRWDDEGFDGPAGGPIARVRWDEVRAADVYRIRRRLVELRPPEERRGRALDLLTYLASREDARAFLERARQDARAAGADQATIDQAIELATARAAERAARDALKAAASLERRSPERGPFPVAPWPTVKPEERDALLTDLRRRVVGLLSRSGREPTSTEGESCIVWSDLGIEDAAKVALAFDRFVAASMPRLGVPADDPQRRLRWGKTAVIVLEGSDRFRLFEATAFNQEVAADLGGIVHYDGPDAIVVLQALQEPAARSIELARGAARSLLHRLDSPIRLPRWAHEGLVDWLVLADPPTKEIDRGLRPVGLTVIRGGGSLKRVLQLEYDDPDPPRQGDRAAGYLLLGFLAEQSPDATRRFVATVKSGEPWIDAFRQAFGATPAAFLERARRFYWLND